MKDENEQFETVVVVVVELKKHVDSSLIYGDHLQPWKKKKKLKKKKWKRL